MVATTAAVIGAGIAVKSSLDAKKAQGDALKQQKDQNESNAAFLAGQTAKARQDILPLFAQAGEQRAAGFQGAADILAQGAPAQIAALQAGNVGAQEALIAGRPLAINALLGLPSAMGAPQAQTLANPLAGLVAPQIGFQSGAGAILAAEAAAAETAAAEAEAKKAAALGLTF